ncbi:hypothetical protein T492DRAFT_298884 [Pavlovales sp. CCMP2436]|nr:hypothetical protein T492DRAFT_298884 [Pavlovales sp. CCMP2436]
MGTEHAASLASLAGHGVAHTSNALIAIRRRRSEPRTAKALGLRSTAPLSAQWVPGARPARSSGAAEEARGGAASISPPPSAGLQPDSGLRGITAGLDLLSLDGCFEKKQLEDHAMLAARLGMTEAAIRRAGLGALRECSFFAQLPEPVLERLAELAGLAVLERYQTVYRYGAPVTCAFVVVIGQVIVTPLHMRPTLLGRGALFGLTALLPARAAAGAGGEGQRGWQPESVEAEQQTALLKLSLVLLEELRTGSLGARVPAARALASLAVARWCMEMVQQVSLFEGASEVVSFRIVGLCTPRLMRKGGVVFLQGDVGSHFYLLVSGAVEIEQTHAARGFPDGRTEKLRLIKHTDHSPFFGELALESAGKARSASATVVDDTVLLEVGAEQFRKLLLLHPTLLKHLREVRCVVYSAPRVEMTWLAARAERGEARRVSADAQGSDARQQAHVGEEDEEGDEEGGEEEVEEYTEEENDAMIQRLPWLRMSDGSQQIDLGSRRSERATATASLAGSRATSRRGSSALSVAHSPRPHPRVCAKADWHRSQPFPSFRARVSSGRAGVRLRAVLLFMRRLRAVGAHKVQQQMAALRTKVFFL